MMYTKEINNTVSICACIVCIYFILLCYLDHLFVQNNAQMYKLLQTP